MFSDGRLGGLVLSMPLLAASAPTAVARQHQQQSRPSLGQIGRVTLTTALEDFDNSDRAFGAAIAWHRDRLSEAPDRRAPHFACAEYGEGKRAMNKLEELVSKTALRRISNGMDHGTCFVVTMSFSQAAAASQHLQAYGLASFGPVPSVLKIAPGLLNHGGLEFEGGDEQQQQRLTTTHGNRLRFENVAGLEVSLSPGVLPAQDGKAGAFISDLIEALMLASADLHGQNFWSDRAYLDGEGEGSSSGGSAHDLLAGPAGAVRRREWARAAAVVHELSSDVGGPTPGDVCSWGTLKIHHADSDVLMVKGMDHLLPLGRGAGGKNGPESDELQMACLMGLMSGLAAAPEVQRISPFHVAELKNAVAGAVVQSGTISDKPLSDAGLDGTGEIIQIVDTGLDETSCFFVDEDGLQVEHGHYFEELGFVGIPSADNSVAPFEGGSFPVDLSRRKVVQYIRLVRDDYLGSPYGEYFDTPDGAVYSWYDEPGFGFDLEAGHGTHTAGSAAGATVTTPAETATCDTGRELGCLGECMTTAEANAAVEDVLLQWKVLCPQFDCDESGGTCLSEDVAETLESNGGVARGAKLSIFDASTNGAAMWAFVAGNGLWNATVGTGCVLHSNSWGSDADCAIDSATVAFDQYMYENPEHLLLFAAGNEGDLGGAGRAACTINVPAIGKNVLAVGASSSGRTRFPVTVDEEDFSDIDTMSIFSSYGPTSDGRIKPEVVAPGDQVLSAGSDGTNSHSCYVRASYGTSMATPMVAGAAAMIRQYFRNASFYEDDVTRRGLCADLPNANDTNSFICEAFSPAAATLKAMLVNGANLMGGSSEPDGSRGFGRVHLEAGLPLDAEGDLGLFVADAFQVEIEDKTVHEYQFEVLPNTGLELRATLAWLDPPASAESSVQLMNDLDLTLVAPDATSHRMWSGGADDRNVIERVIVSSGAVTSGTWTVAVSCYGLTTESQPYSLIVTGPIDVGSGAFSQGEASAPPVEATVTSILAFLAIALAAYAVVYITRKTLSAYGGHK